LNRIKNFSRVTEMGNPDSRHMTEMCSGCIVC